MKKRVDALKGIEDIGQKFELFRSHKARVAKAQEFQSQLEETLKKECQNKKSDYPTECVITIDWKMRFQERATREMTVMHFGKRGISWHGIMLMFFKWSNTANCAACHIVYLHQILDGTTLQDGYATVSMVEAGLKTINYLFPF